MRALDFFLVDQFIESIWNHLTCLQRIFFKIKVWYLGTRFGYNFHIGHFKYKITKKTKISGEIVMYPWFSVDSRG